MGKRIELKVGDRIPRTDGTLSGFVYLGDATSSNQFRRVRVRCSCGREYDAKLHRIRSGEVNYCQACKHLATATLLYEPGSVIPRLDGTPSGFILVRQLDVKAHHRFCIALCPECGEERELSINRIRSGQSTCDACLRYSPEPGARIFQKDGTPTSFSYLREAGYVTNSRKVRVVCDCGKELTTKLARIRSGNQLMCKRCYYFSRNQVELGKLYGRLIAKERRDVVVNGRPVVKFLCQCSCGNDCVIASADLLNGNTKSCGCYKDDRMQEVFSVTWKPGDVLGPFRIIERASRCKDGGSKFRVYDLEQRKERVVWQSFIRIQADPFEAFKFKLRGRLRGAVKTFNFERLSSNYSDLSFTEEDVRASVGVCPGYGWQLDHICPLACSQTTAEAVALCALENLQWLPASENLSKKAKWTPEGARLHKKLLGREWENSNGRNV